MADQQQTDSLSDDQAAPSPAETGRSIRKIVPSPGSLYTMMVPPCARTLP